LQTYLESSKGYPNVGIYEKMGFELVKEIECVDGGDVCKVRLALENLSQPYSLDLGLRIMQYNWDGVRQSFNREHH
jgi:hypothetical protein